MGECCARRDNDDGDLTALEGRLLATRDDASAALEAVRGRVADQIAAREACADKLEGMRAEEAQLTAALDLQNSTKVR